MKIISCYAWGLIYPLQAVFLLKILFKKSLYSTFDVDFDKYELSRQAKMSDMSLRHHIA